MIKLSLFKMAALAALLALVSACGESDNSSEADQPVTSVAQQITLDARGQEVYDTNCAVCHAMPGSGAPQTGVSADWQERTAKGMDTMLDNAMDGFQAMPAMGGCFDCGEDDFRQLIAFMTNGALN